MYILGMFALLVLSVLANVLGIVARADSWVITILLIAAALAVAGFAAKSRWDGIFIDQDNRISLSRFQLILWTVLLVSALFTAGLTNATPPDAVSDPLRITIPPEIWALLGLGAFTAVAAPAIEQGKRGLPNAPGVTDAELASRDARALRLQHDQKLNAPPVADGQLLVKSTGADARWMDLIMGDTVVGGFYVDVSKLQKLAFTLLIVTVYGFGLWQEMAGTHPFIRNFPPADDALLALLAISHAAYLADKQIAST